MDYNEILTAKLEQCIETFNGFNAEKIDLNTKLIVENIKQIKGLHDSLKSIEIPKEIILKNQYTYEHKHLNAGVRFMLVTLLSVILISTCVSVYFYSRYTEVKGFVDNFDYYNKTSDWQLSFLEYMRTKHPKDTEAYMKDHPLLK